MDLKQVNLNDKYELETFKHDKNQSIHVQKALWSNSIAFGKCFVGYHVPMVATYLHDLLQVSPVASRKTQEAQGERGER